MLSIGKIRLGQVTQWLDLCFIGHIFPNRMLHFYKRKVFEDE